MLTDVMVTGMTKAIAIITSNRVKTTAGEVSAKDVGLINGRDIRRFVFLTRNITDLIIYKQTR